MKFIKTIIGTLVLLFVVASFSQCSTSKKMQKKAPVKIAETYSQSWISGIQGGGGGINVFIKLVDKSKTTLDSLYFRGKVVTLEHDEETSYVARFLSDINTVPKDFIMSGDTKEEFGNTMPLKREKFPFELKDNEAIASYKDNGKRKYFKIQDIQEKPALAMPSSPPNNRLN